MIISGLEVVMRIHSQRLVELLLFTLFLFVIVFSVISFGRYMKYNKKLVDNDALEVRFETSDIIEVTNRLPITDTLGKDIKNSVSNENIHGYVDFFITNKTNKNVSYEIFLTKQSVDGKEISGNYVKFYLTNGDNQPFSEFAKNIIPTYSDLENLKDRPSSKLLYTGIINGHDTQNLKLRIWVSDSYAISTILESFRIDVDVRIK